MLVAVHQPHGYVNPEALKVLPEGQDNALETFLEQQHLKGQWLAGFRVHHLAVADAVAGLLQQLHGRAQVIPHGGAVTGRRRRVGLGENSRVQLIPERLENLQLAAGGQAGGGQVAVLEITIGTNILIEEQVTVGPFKIKNINQGPAYLRVFEHCYASDEDKALHAAGAVVFNRSEERRVGREWR